MSRRAQLRKGHDLARAARYPRSRASLPHFFRYARRFHFRCSAETFALGKLAGHGASRIARKIASRFYGEPGKYLAFLGRTSPEKGLDQAIQIAKRVGMPLKIAAKVDRADEQYFETVIKPLLNDPLIEFIGEIGYSEKNAFSGQCRRAAVSHQLA